MSDTESRYHNQYQTVYRVYNLLDCEVQPKSLANKSLQLDTSTHRGIIKANLQRTEDRGQYW